MHVEVTVHATARVEMPLNYGPQRSPSS